MSMIRTIIPACKYEKKEEKKKKKKGGGQEKNITWCKLGVNCQYVIVNT